MSRRTLALIIGLLLVTALLLYFALSSKTTKVSNTQPETKPFPTIAQSAILKLSPNPLTVTSVASRSASSLSVEIDTQGEEVTGVQLELTYDPKAIGTITITQGSFFESPIVLINTVDQQTGKASYAIAISPGQAAKKGTGTVATINFRPLITTGNTSIAFLPKTTVTSPGKAGSVLKTSLGAVIQFGSQTAPKSATSTPALSTP